MRFGTLFDSLKGRRLRSHGSKRRRGGSLQWLNSVESFENRILPAAVLTITDAYIVEGNSGVQQVAIDVRLSDPHGNSVTVDYRSLNGTATQGSDYSAVSGKLTFNKGQNSKTILVPVQGDRSSEPDESFSIVLSNAKGAKIADGTGIVTIQDDEPRISISDAWGNEGNTGTTPFLFTISLSSESDLPVTVHYATANGAASEGSDYTALSDSYTFAPGETSKDIFVDVIGDQAIESNEWFVVNVTSSDAEIARGAGTGTIYDDEPQISIGDVYYPSGYGYGVMTFWVYLSNASDEVVTVDYATADYTAFEGADYVATAGTLTFESGETAKSFDVAVLNDSAYDVYFFVTLSNVTGDATIVAPTAIGYWYYDYWYYGGYDYGYYDYGYGYYY